MWDIDVYDNCIQGGYTTQTCCVLSGGEYDPEAVTCYAPAKVQTEPGSGPGVPPQVANGTLPTVATNAPATTAPGSRAPGRLPTGGVAAP